ncbi:MAG: cupin domain-containing protein [Bacteroidota bacterium]
MKSSIENSVHYKWGNGCHSYIFLNDKNLSVKFEKMPAGTSEEKHFHKLSQQYFFILKGEAVFEIVREDSFGEKEKIIVSANEGIHISANTKHKIINASGSEIEFLVISQPSADGDREQSE